MTCKPRWIVRPPQIFTTPSILKGILDANKIKKYDPSRNRIYHFDKDLFLIYPHPRLVEASDKEVYKKLYSFFSGDKPSQRGVLEQCSVPTIPYATRTTNDLESKRFVPESTYIVRPLRHSGGKDYKITTGHSDFTEGKEYISVFFPKKREYRVIFYRGVPIITLRKRIPDGVNNLQPWNHANGSSFVTVEREENNHLIRTNFYESMKDVFFIKNSHLIGVDILLDKNNNYVVVEVNCCPALTIEKNLELLKQVHTKQFCLNGEDEHGLSVPPES